VIGSNSSGDTICFQGKLYFNQTKNGNTSWHSDSGLPMNIVLKGCIIT